MPPPEEPHDDPAVLQAIASDSRLTRPQRAALREVYEAFVATSAASRRRARQGSSAR
jgi:hypothetical protein